MLEQAENELRLSQVEFDRQAEITKLLMEGLSQSQTNHVRHLKAFVAAQVEYYAQAHLVMQDLNRELNRFDKTRKYFIKLFIIISATPWWDRIWSVQL